MQSISRRPMHNTVKDHNSRQGAWRAYDHEGQDSSKSSYFSLRGYAGKKRLRHTVVFVIVLALLLYAKNTSYYSREGLSDDPFSHIPPPDPSDRLTAYATWTGSTYKEYLRHYIHSVRQNADMLDVVFLNRKGEASGCVDFAENNVSLPSNFHQICIEDHQWTAKHANFFCSSWSCTEQEYSDVVARLDERLQHDHKNSEFHPFLGQVFGEYNPSGTPYWAWTDVDMILGRMVDFPFNILSTVSFLITSNTRNLFLHGQFTAFNAKDRELATAWMREGDFVSPRAFIESNEALGEELYWSRAYLRSDDGHAGTQLSWAAVPYTVTSDRAAGDRYILVSGRDVLTVWQNVTTTKEEIRNVLQSARAQTRPGTGVDLSTTHEDFTMAKSYWWNIARDDYFREGIETIEWLSEISMKTGYDCIGNHFIPAHQTQCLPQHVFELITPTSVRPSYIRRAGNKAGTVHRRYSLLLDKIDDQETEEEHNLKKTYTKVAYAHFLLLKHHTLFPDFEVDEGKYMLIKPLSNEIEVHSLQDDDLAPPIFSSISGKVVKSTKAEE